MRRRQLLGAAALGSLGVGVGHSVVSRSPGSVAERSFREKPIYYGSFTEVPIFTDDDALTELAETANLSVPRDAEAGPLYPAIREFAETGPHVGVDADTGTVEVLGVITLNPECEYVGSNDVAYDEAENALRLDVTAVDAPLSCIIGRPQPLSYGAYRIEVRFAERWVADYGLPTRVVATDDGGTTSARQG